ncbi:hypothetical protein SAMN05444369_104134 [Capnocytophaga haemolytica]|uniref:Haloacid dehalogenase n=1 Tax=Capnocytophaga haemolytica TaxID=45243 RepID=A0AAX2H2G1_9FLAO|nr:Cof-type HAD-IIB family hydrolase [Capnocytophaga haemolytica]AMD85678.1 haloacid dehalogenase [Capnocytophaga haemolytica]SFN90534.1 hypothetical protein SAMN05444369_104134 [Capnocytophaga haemolytica]SNV16437.1 sugar phosphate phosphatase [Capnocytophaga haemolytica]
MKQYQIIFSDVDGTLLNNERGLSHNTISAVKHLKGHIPFVLVSSRMPKQMEYLQRQLGILELPLIAYNGALVREGEQVLHSTEIPLSIAEQIVLHNEETFDGQIHISLYHNDLWYAPADDFWAKCEAHNTRTEPQILSNRAAIEQWKAEGVGVHKLMLMGEEALIDEMFRLLIEQFSSDLHIYRGKETYIEVSDAKVSKLTGIKLLLEKKYHLPLSAVVAFGDNYNDLEMIEGVGCGVAVANARQEVKQVADYITTHHKEDGVAHFLKEHLVANQK